MNSLQHRLIGAGMSLAAVICLGGCAATAAVATASADAKQQPAVAFYTSRKPVDAVFTASVQAMSSMGKVVSQDRTSGVVQGEKGSWLINVNLAPSGTGSRMQVSARFVPSNKLDFSSREALTNEFVGLVERNTGEKLALASQ